MSARWGASRRSFGTRRPHVATVRGGPIPDNQDSPPGNHDHLPSVSMHRCARAGLSAELLNERCAIDGRQDVPQELPQSWTLA